MQIMGSVLLIILPTFELLQTKHQLVLTVVGFLPPKRARSSRWRWLLIRQNDH